MPLSFAQRRLWFLEQLEPGTAVYNVAGEVRLRGRLDVAALANAFAEVLRRHEVLRTVYAMRGGGRWRPLTPCPPLPSHTLPPARAGTRALPFIDLVSLWDHEREVTADRLALDEARRSFDLARGPVCGRCCFSWPKSTSSSRSITSRRTAGHSAFSWTSYRRSTQDRLCGSCRCSTRTMRRGNGSGCRKTCWKASSRIGAAVSPGCRYSSCRRIALGPRCETRGAGCAR